MATTGTTPAPMADFHFSSDDDTAMPAAPAPADADAKAPWQTFDDAVKDGVAQADAAAATGAASDKENDDEDEDGKKKKKKKKSTRPTLDKDRLLNEKTGVPELAASFPLHFRDKFGKVVDGEFVPHKGKEQQSLNLLMSKYQGWADKLFPAYNFSDFCEKVEDLGQKRDVQQYVRDIRRGYEAEVEAKQQQDEYQSSDDEHDPVADDGPGGTDDDEDGWEALDATSAAVPPKMNVHESHTAPAIDAEEQAKAMRLERVRQQREALLQRLAEQKRREQLEAELDEAEADAEAISTPAPSTNQTVFEASNAATTEADDVEMEDAPPALSDEAPRESTTSEDTTFSKGDDDLSMDDSSDEAPPLADAPVLPMENNA